MRFRFVLVTIVLFAVAAFPQSQLPSAKVAPEKLKQYSDLAVDWMQQYLRINTTNPPGNEEQAALWYKKILDAEGIENQIFPYAPHRANIWARIKGSGAKRPVILLNHMDVVSSDPKRWRVPPFSAQILDGAIYGRGAQDMKGEGLAQLVTMVMLQREKPQLDRDIIFLATPDEEVDGTGTDWMIANKRDLLGNAEFLITEGGENLLEKGKVKYVGVDVAEKSTFWLKVTAVSKPGHGSHPLVDSAPNHLIAALNKIIHYQTDLKLTPVVAEYMRVMAQFESPERAAMFRDFSRRMNDPGFKEKIAADDINPQVRNTISLTMLGGSGQTNVIPGEAWANLDVRLLPGEDPSAFLQKLKALVNDPKVTIEPQNKDFRTSNSSPTNTELFDVFKRVAAQDFGGAPVAPSLTSGYTENQRFRSIGVASYGFSPYAVTEEESSTEHGDNERIRVEEVRRGYRVYYDVLTTLAGKQK